MFEKIKYSTDILFLKRSELLVEYPLNGAIADTIDFSDPEQFRIYEVTKIEGKMITIKCEEINPDEFNKPLNSLLLENRWWKRNEL